MSKENKLLSQCPPKRELELFSLETGLSRAEKLCVQRHLLQCNRCRRGYRALDRFYSLLVSEMRKPVTNLTLDTAKSFAPKPVRYGLLLCTPIPDRNSRSAKAYRTQLVFSANGEPGRRKLRDFDLIRIPQDCLAIRLYTDPSYNEMSIFLWQHDLGDASPFKLRWSATRKALSFNQIGRSTMALSNFSSLDNRLIYLSKTDRKKRTLGRFESICSRMDSDVSL
jgi:hypothetical protein